MTSSSQSGFAMVEAIAALAVSAIVAAGLMAALGGASTRAAEAQVRSIALRQAQALIAEAMMAQPAETSPAVQLKAKGSLADPALEWTRTIHPLGEAFPGIERVRVVVLWSTLRASGETQLEAYRISPP
jgi:type II secretory pathway pseudopilin PulG